MTDFQKVIDYYNSFDEKNRLVRDNSGRLEYEMTMRILQKYLPQTGRVLDIGGGAGVYAFPLAKARYKVHLADLSERLIAQAREQKRTEKVENMVSVDVVNAIDLSRYEDGMFDVVVALGPFYHLTDAEERRRCASEISRVVKTGGLVFAGFIPYLSGSIGVVERYFRLPSQVDANTISEVFTSGRFHNLENNGFFQEGYYATAEEMERMFTDNYFETECIRSIRGFGYEREDSIYQIKDESVYAEVMNCIEKTAENKAIVEMCGHAMYIGRKTMPQMT